MTLHTTHWSGIPLTSADLRAHSREREEREAARGRRRDPRIPAPRFSARSESCEIIAPTVNAPKSAWMPMYSVASAGKEKADGVRAPLFLASPCPEVPV